MNHVKTDYAPIGEMDLKRRRENMRKTLAECEAVGIDEYFFVLQLADGRVAHGWGLSAGPAHLDSVAEGLFRAYRKHVGPDLAILEMEALWRAYALLTLAGAGVGAALSAAFHYFW
jgi:hypothetical protein